MVIDDGNQYVYGAGLSTMKQSGSWYYYLADGLGSTMAVVGSSGNSQKSYQYDVYGEVTGGSGSFSNEFDFAGQQTDATGLQYLRARYYDPETGTFLSRDPLESDGGRGIGAFSYASGRPTQLVDPSGLYPGEDIWGKVNSPEGRFCASRPWWWSRCGEAAADTAFAFAMQYAFFGRTETPASDAFRHCVWSACLTISIGAHDATTFTNVHEHGDHTSSLQDHRKDLWNNQTGREIGERWAFLGEYAGKAAAVLDCLDAVSDGRLIIDPDTAPAYPKEGRILWVEKGTGSW